MKIVAIIPARLKSTRLKDKLLLKINDIPIIQHTYNNVCKIELITDIIILTDNIKVKNVVDNFINQKHSCHVINEECLNGTERIIVYLQKYNKIEYPDDTIIVNVQGDEPFINPYNVDLAIQNYINKINKIDNLVCSTIYHTTNNCQEIENKNRGKLVLDNNNNIMYCSRNIIPNYFYNIHIGVFVYNYNYIMNHFYKINTPLQLLEDIEWLKIIEQGYKINAIEVKEHIRGVDTQEDYDYLNSKYQKDI